MPFTYNGVGTHYYGKRNIHKRIGPCTQCGRPAELTSYDTRLWFVILFIPVFPLGRKRILDYCPHCTRHFAAEADKWEAAKQLELSGAQEQFRASQSPEDAIALHQQFLNFHQFDQAAEFRKTMREKFASHATVHAYLGAALQHFGKLDEAAACFSRALELRPDLPEARIGVARTHIRTGRLEDARKLLDFLEKDGAAQLYSLEPLDTLSRAFQQAGRHEDALALFAVIQRELPKLAEEKWFRALVTRSEKALKRPVSQLPKLKFSLKRLFTARNSTQPAVAGRLRFTWKSMVALGVMIGLILLGFVISNEYIRRHRTLHIVNDGPTSTVRIAGLAPTTCAPGVTSMTLPEGRYHASISGPVPEELDFEVRASYWSRCFDDPAWVLNLGGKAVLIQTTAVYSSNPQPESIQVHFGKGFECYPRITHPFTDLPSSLQMKAGETRTLVQLELFRGEAANLFGYFIERRDSASAMNFAEQRLQAEPGDELMLRTYAAGALQFHLTNRLDAFLHTGLAVRPLRIEWHRVYQSLHDTAPAHAALVAEYQALLRAEPANAPLLYLCGRLEPDRAKARDFFQRAAAADPQCPYPHFALAFDYMAAGDWAGALPSLERALALRPADASWQHWRMLARLATGDGPSLEKEARALIARNAGDLSAAMQLIDLLAAQDRRDDANTALAAFRSAAGPRYGSQLGSITMSLRCRMLYELGEFQELEKLTATSPGNALGFRLQALLELGRIADALKLSPRVGDELERPLFSLAVSLAYLQAGDASQSQHWAAQARNELARGSDDEARAAGLLGRAPAAVSVDDLKAVALQPQLKAALAAWLSATQPSNRVELAAFARRLNVERTFPYHLIQRATERVQ
jgi:tetratricopeptide (TPR) repeat protein